MPKSSQVTQVDWYRYSVKDTVNHLHSSLSRGLADTDVEKRRTHYGLNLLQAPPPTPLLLKIFAELNDYLIWILLAGAGLSLYLGEYLDGLLIIIIVAFMTILGLVQNAKAEGAIASLKKLTSFKTNVIRDGQAQTLDTSELVPGDLVVLKAGDAVPADLRIVHENNVAIDESTLTGESVPTQKYSTTISTETPLAERKNIAYSGTLVVEGSLRGLVVAIGMETELGKIAHLLEGTKSEPSPLEIQLDKLGKTIGTALLLVVALILALNLAHQVPLLHAAIDAVALAIAAVPEGLPAVITLCLAFGTQEMVKRKALVRKLKAVEALGSISVICTDKTGTLTTGEMSVTETWTKTAPSELWHLIASCNNDADMTERALTSHLGEHFANLVPSKRLKEFEFNSLLKRMTVIIHSHNGYFAVSKGAPEVLLAHSTHLQLKTEAVPISRARREELNTLLKTMAGRGLRVLAITKRELRESMTGGEREQIEQNLTLVGLIGISDPPKTEVKDAIAATLKAGITPIMITGDNPYTAQAIAKQLSWQKIKVLTGEGLDDLVESGRSAHITEFNIFARVSPEQKSHIVQAFQSSGRYVAMIGDGVNDAPSVKLANVGVSMGIRGSDVTKSAADLILLDDNYATLVVAVEEGRNILSRIRLFVSYLLSCNLAEIAIFATCALLRLPIPLTAVMLLVLNIVTDAAPALAMAKEPKDESVMTHAPRDPQEPIINLALWGHIGIITLISTLAVMIAYLYGLRYGTLIGETMAFATLSMLELFRAYTARSMTKSIVELGFFTNTWMLPSVAIGLVVTLCIVYLGDALFQTVPLSLPLLVVATSLALLGPLGEETVKWVRRKLVSTV